MALCAASAQAQQPGKAPLKVKLGVLSDMSGLYADIGGQGSVIAAPTAVEDFNPANHKMKI
jgi:branched-chain amino acid transport system substrate-binding protein